MTKLSFNDGFYHPEPFDSVRACSMRGLEKLRYLSTWAQILGFTQNDNLIRAQGIGLRIEWLNAEIYVFFCYLPRFDRKRTHATASPIMQVIEVPSTMFW